MQNKANERRSLVRLPFMLKFRLRNDKGSKTYQARSCDIDPCGIQIETSAPIVPKMEVELWPEDYSANSSYVHGEVIWVKPLDGGDNQRCGITFNRKIDWSIPWPVLAKTYVAPTGSGTHMSSEFVLDSIVDGVFSVDNKWKITSFNSAAEQLTGWKREDALGKT